MDFLTYITFHDDLTLEEITAGTEQQERFTLTLHCSNSLVELLSFDVQDVRFNVPHMISLSLSYDAAAVAMRNRMLRPPQGYVAAAGRCCGRRAMLRPHGYVAAAVGLCCSGPWTVPPTAKHRWLHQKHRIPRVCHCVVRGGSVSLISMERRRRLYVSEGGTTRKWCRHK